MAQVDVWVCLRYANNDEQRFPAVRQGETVRFKEDDLRRMLEARHVGLEMVYLEEMTDEEVCARGEAEFEARMEAGIVWAENGGEHADRY